VLALAGGVGPDGKRLVRAETFAELTKAQNTIPLEGAARVMNPDTEKLGYGLGWIVSDHRGKRVLAHGGMIDGFRAQVTFLPDDKLGVAVLNNLHETRMNQAVTNTLIDLYCGLPARDWNRFFRKLVADEEAEKRAAEAERELVETLAGAPTFTDAAVDLARLHMANGRGADAVDLLADLLTRDPYHFDALIALGQALQAIARPADALIAFGRVLRFDPSHVEALFHQGLVLGTQSRNRDAMDRWHRVIAIDSDGQFALRARHELHVMLERQRSFTSPAAA